MCKVTSKWQVLTGAYISLRYALAICIWVVLYELLAACYSLIWGWKHFEDWFCGKKTNSLFSHILLSIYSCWSLGLARQWCVTDLELVHDGAPSARTFFMILRLRKTILSNVFFKMLKSCSCVHVNNGTSPYVYCNNNFILKNPSFFQTDHNHCFSVTLFNSLLV